MSKDRWNGTSLFLNSSLFKKTRRRERRICQRRGYTVPPTQKTSDSFCISLITLSMVTPKEGFCLNHGKVLENIVIPFMSQMCLFLLPFLLFLFFSLQSVIITVVTLQIQVNSLKLHSWSLWASGLKWEFDSRLLFNISMLMGLLGILRKCFNRRVSSRINLHFQTACTSGTMSVIKAVVRVIDSHLKGSWSNPIVPSYLHP